MNNILWFLTVWCQNKKRILNRTINETGRNSTKKKKPTYTIWYLSYSVYRNTWKENVNVILQLVECSRIQSHIFSQTSKRLHIFAIMTVYVLKYSVCELIMEVDQGQKWKKKKKKKGRRVQNRTTGFRDGGGRSRMWIRGPDGDRGPKAAWHLTCFISSRVTFHPLRHRPPATDAAATHRNRNDNVRQRKGIIQNQGPGHGLCARRDWESSRFASDLSVSLMQRRPQIHYKPIICARAGAGAGHSLVNCSA